MKPKASRSLRLAWLLAATTLAMPAGQALAARPTSTALEHQVTEAMPGLLSKFSVPGAAVALIRDGKVVWMHGYGLADVAGARPVTTETEFNVGSISKTPTAWAVMHLAEQGKIDLDAPVDRYLKRWHLPPSAFDNNQVTVRRVLSHTSGISEHDFHGWDPASPLPPIEDVLSGKTGTGQVQVIAQPGAAFRYSGANYLILALLIEDVSGQPFQTYMKSNILLPLHMTQSQYGLPDAYATTMATGYDALGKPLPTLRYNELAAAGLTTDLRDLATFAEAALARKHGRKAGRAVLKPETLALMAQAQPNSRWADKDPYGPDPQYGLGYTVRPQQLAGQTGIGHGGSNSGWESLFQVVPVTGDGIVIMTNSSNGSAVIANVLCAWRHWQAGPDRTVACPTVDIAIPLWSAYRRGGAAAAVALYRQLRRDEPDGYDVSIRQLNAMGYQVMRMGDVPGAIALFQLNVEAYPAEWNVYDSLGEAYLKAGDRENAIKNYRMSLQLNPGNDNGRQVLKSLGASIE